MLLYWNGSPQSMRILMASALGKCSATSLQHLLSSWHLYCNRNFNITLPIVDFLLQCFRPMKVLWYFRMNQNWNIQNELWKSLFYKKSQKSDPFSPAEFRMRACVDVWEHAAGWSPLPHTALTLQAEELFVLSITGLLFRSCSFHSPFPEAWGWFGLGLLLGCYFSQGNNPVWAWHRITNSRFVATGTELATNCSSRGTEISYSKGTDNAGHRGLAPSAPWGSVQTLLIPTRTGCTNLCLWAS